MAWGKISVLALALALAGCSGREEADDGGRDYEAGVSALAAGDLKRAAESFAECARKDVTNLAARLQLAAVACRLGDAAAAEAAAAGALALDPDSAEALLADGEAAYLSRKFSRARADFSAVAGCAGLPAALRAQGFVSAAVVELAENDPIAARLALWRALKCDRRYPAVWYHLAYLSRNVFHHDSAALEQYQFFARLADPADGRTREVVHKTIPALRSAIAAAAADRPGAARRDPSAAAKLLAQGEEALRRKRTKAAGEKFEQAFAADPLSFPAARAYADALSRMSGVKGGADRVLDVYGAAIDANPASGETHLIAARYALRNGRPQRAAEIMSRLLSRNPSSRSALELYAEALAKSGKPRAAAACRVYARER